MNSSSTSAAVASAVSPDDASQKPAPASGSRRRPAPAQPEAKIADAPTAPTATAADISADLPAELVMPNISPEDGMRYYAAILGHEPTLDPEAPDLLPGTSGADGADGRSWAGDIGRTLRNEIASKLHLKLKRRPSWRELMDAMTVAASRRVEEARKRLQRRNAA